MDDKYIQQDAEDQERAFQLAFTLQLVLSSAFVVLIVLAILYALACGNWEVVLPGVGPRARDARYRVPGTLWTYYRRLDYLRQRQLQMADPVVRLVVNAVGMMLASAILIAVRLFYPRRLVSLRPILVNALYGMVPAVVALTCATRQRPEWSARPTPTGPRRADGAGRATGSSVRAT